MSPISLTATPTFPETVKGTPRFVTRSALQGILPYRRLYFADIHLGEETQAECLLEIFDYIDPSITSEIHGVGDLMEIAVLRSQLKLEPVLDQSLTEFFKPYYGSLPRGHRKVLGRGLALAHQGIRIILQGGNTDWPMRNHIRQYLRADQGDLLIKKRSTWRGGSIELTDGFTFQQENGRWVWVIHGDEFDETSEAKMNQDAAGFGQRMDVRIRSLLWRSSKAVSKTFDLLSPMTGLPEEFLLGFAKNQLWGTRQLVRFLSRNYRNTLAKEAQKRGVQVVVFSHDHIPGITEMNGILLVDIGSMSDGDYTFVGEREDGRFEIIRWKPEARRRDSRERLRHQSG